MVGVGFDERSERAQLILVGAVAIAFIVLGLAVVFNTVLYTENVASTGAAEAPRNAQHINQEVEYGAKRLIARTNLDGKYISETELRDGIEANVSAYGTGLTKTVGAKRGVIVSLDALDGNDAGGSDVIGAAIQSPDRQFRDSIGQRNWKVVDESPGAAPFGDFNMTVRPSSLAEEGSSNMFRAVWNATETNDNYTVWIYEAAEDPDGDGKGDVAFRVISDSSNPAHEFPSASEECILEGTDDADQVEFRFSEGRVVGHPSCSDELNVDDGLPSDAQRTLSFHDGDGAAGWFSLVVNDEDAVASGVNHATTVSDLLPSNAPYYTDATWEVELQVEYDSDSVSYTETYVIEVYNRSR